MIENIRPSLLSYFAPALLGRMTIVPFLPLAQDIISQIVNLKLRTAHGSTHDQSPDQGGTRSCGRR